MANIGPSPKTPRTLSLRKRILFRLLTCLCGFLAAVAVGELALRVAGWPAPGLYQNRRGPIVYRESGRDGGAFPPGAGRFVHYDYDVEWIVNSHGFREREPERKKPGEWRIGLLGDSMGIGTGVRVDERLADIWFSQVRERMPEARLWNLCSPLSGTIHEAEILDGVGREYNLDEIILAFYSGNDLVETDAWYRKDKDVWGRSWTGPVRDWVRENSRLATFLWYYGLRANLFSQKRPGSYSSSSLQELWPPTERALNRCKEVVGDRPFTIWYIPYLPEWDDKIWQDWKEKYGLTDEGRFVVKEAVARWASEHQVAFVDTTKWLRQGSATDCLFPTDGHWNVHGNRLVGVGLAADPQSTWRLKRP